MKCIGESIQTFGDLGLRVTLGKSFQTFGDLGFTGTNALGVIVNIRRFGFTGHFTFNLILRRRSPCLH
jgi:hypothetical protein